MVRLSRPSATSIGTRAALPWKGVGITTSPSLRLSLALLTLVVLVVAGCATDDQAETTGTLTAETTVETSGSDQAPSTASAGAGGKQILMLGRSVMYDWFKHWGWDGSLESLPLAKDGYSLSYKELKEPDEIADSATGFMDEAPEGSAVFFKFCFVDFPGQEEPAARFEHQKQWIAQVAAKADERGQLLVIGNALPKTSGETDATLVAEHREFNAWLDEYASQSGGKIHVYDFYGVLATPEGAIKPEYASSADDAHPNDAGFSELDPSLFQLLDEVTQ